MTDGGQSIATKAAVTRCTLQHTALNQYTRGKSTPDNMSTQDYEKAMTAPTPTPTPTPIDPPTTANSDVQWEGDDGNENSGTIVQESSCNLLLAQIANGEELHNSTGSIVELVKEKAIVDTQIVAHSPHEYNITDYIVHGSDIDNNENTLKRKASHALEEIASIPIDTDLNPEELPELPVATDAAVTATQPKRARHAVSSRISWEERIADLRAYQEEHGDLQIPIRYRKNPSLGKFVHNTREQYKLFQNQNKAGYQKRCSLTAERIDELNQIGFIWTTERIKKQNDDWNARLEQLKEYKSRHGDCLVPHGYEADPSFAEWIHRQRTAYAAFIKEEKPNPLVQSRIAKLEEIGFNFTVHTDKWMDQYLMLKSYKEKHGDCQVPTHYAENPKLGRWTHTQRHQRRLKSKLYKKSNISQERITLLDDLGFNWEVRPPIEQPRATWQQRYDELVEYYNSNGNFLISPEMYPKLHRWCYEQRSRLLKLETVAEGSPTTDGGQSRRMGPDRVKLLADIGFTCNTVLAKPNCSSTDLQHSETNDCPAQHATVECNDATGPKTLTPVAVEANGTETVTSVVQSELNPLDDEKIASI